MTKGAESANVIGIKKVGSTGSRSKNNPAMSDLQGNQGCPLRKIVQNIAQKGGKTSIDLLSSEIDGLTTIDRASAIKSIQSTRGNRYVQRIVAQAKMAVSQPGDEYEQEADQTAARIMNMSEPEIHSKVETKEKRMTMPPRNRLTLLHLESVVPGAGQPLPDPSRNFFEPRIGHDLSRVRIHTDDNAAESAKAMEAKAYTIGQNIVFDPGHYSPETYAGKRLIAHELSHVVQQDSGRITSLVQRAENPYQGPPDDFKLSSPPLANNENWEPYDPYDMERSFGLNYDKGEFGICVDNNCSNDCMGPWLDNARPQPKEESDAKKACRKENWNEFMNYCCPRGKYYDKNTKSCRIYGESIDDLNKKMKDLGPLPPKEYNDALLPEDDNRTV